MKGLKKAQLIGLYSVEFRKLADKQLLQIYKLICSEIVLERGSKSGNILRKSVLLEVANARFPDKDEFDKVFPDMSERVVVNKEEVNGA